jgi:hypothetical protein
MERLQSYALSPVYNISPSQASALAAAFLDAGHCEGARFLSDADKATLETIRNRLKPNPQSN